MAEDKITRSQIIEDGLFDNAAKSATEFEKVLNALKVSLSDVAKESNQIYKGAGGANESKQINEVTEALKKQEAIRKEIISTESKLRSIKAQLAAQEQKIAEKKTKQTKTLTAAEIKQRELDKVYSRERTQRLKAEAILMDKNSGEIQKLRAQNVLLRIERDRLNKSDSLYEGNLKRLNDTIDANNEKLKGQVDQLTQQKMNVGNYAESIKDAFREMGFFGQAMTKITSIQKILSSSLKGVRSDIKNLTDQLITKKAAQTADVLGTEAQTAATNRLTRAKKTATVVTKLLGSALKAVGIGLLLSLVAGAGAFFSKIEEGQDAMESFKLQAEAIFNVIAGRLGLAFMALITIIKGVVEEIQILAKEIKLVFTFGSDAVNELKKEIEELKSKQSLKKGVQDMADAFRGMGDEIAAAQKAAKQLAAEIDGYGKIIRRTQLELARLNQTEQQLSLIVNDQTMSFKAREEAQKELEKANTKRAEKELMLSKKQLEFEMRKMAALKGISMEELKMRMETQENTSRLLEKDLAQLLEFQKQVIDAEGEIKKVKEQNAQFERINEQKSFLNRVKVLQQLTKLELDRLKTIAEDSEMSFEDRLEAEQKYAKNSEDIFKKQIEMVQQRTELQVDAADLMNTASEIELEDKIRALELDAKTEKEVSDIISLRKTELATIREIAKKRNDDLKDIEMRNRKAIEQITSDNNVYRVEELKREFENEAKKGNIRISELRRINLEIFEIQKQELIRAAELRIETEKLTADEILAIRNKLELDIKRLKGEEVKSDEEIEKLKLDMTKKYYDNLNSALKQNLEERSRIRQQYFDLEQKQLDRQISQQTELAARGLTNQLAFEEAQRNKAELKRKEQLKREARQRETAAIQEAIFTGYNNNMKQGMPSSQALSKSVQDVILARGVARSVVQFFSEGSSFVDAPWASGKKDDIPAMLMKGEGVVTTSANQSNPGVVEALNKGIFNDVFAPKRAVVGVAENIGFSILAAKLGKVESLLEIIADKPSQRVEVDTFGNIIETVHLKSRIETTKHLINWKK